MMHEPINKIKNLRKGARYYNLQGKTFFNIKLSPIYLNYIYVTLASNMPLIHEFLSIYYIIICSQSDGKTTIKKRREKPLAV
jgi:hypothetical protein